MPHKISLPGDGRFAVIDPSSYDAVLMELFRELPGRKRWNNGKLTFEDTHANWRLVFERLPPPTAVWHASAAERLERAQEALRAREALQDRQRVAGGTENADWCFRHPPFEHQLRGWNISRDELVFAYFMEMGTGKSKLLIDVMAYLHMKGELDLAFIIAPNGVHHQWVEQQIPTHMPLPVEWEAMSLSLDQMKTRTGHRDVADMLASNNQLRIFTLNAEALSHTSGLELALRILSRSKKVMLAVDESSRFSNPQAKRTKHLVKMRDAAKYRRILSGTPVTRGLEDLYAQFLFLEPDAIGTTTFAAFRAEYCLMGGFEGRQIIGYRNEERLQRKIAPLVFTARKADCLDLPEKVYAPVVFDLPPAHREVYRTVKQEALALCNQEVKKGNGELFVDPDGPVTFELTPQGLYFKLMQAAAGFLMHTVVEGGKPEVIWRADPNVRLDLFSAKIQELGGEQAVVWFRYREEYRALAELLTALKISFSSYHGGIKPSLRPEQIALFTNQKVQLFLGQQDAAGTGLNLQNAHDSFYYTNSPNPESRWQSEDRTHRIGQRFSCTYYDFIAKGTVDVNTQNNLRGREKVSNRTYAGLKAILLEEPILLEPQVGDYSRTTFDE